LEINKARKNVTIKAEQLQPVKVEKLLLVRAQLQIVKAGQSARSSYGEREWDGCKQ
jgi:hypothetical protein